MSAENEAVVRRFVEECVNGRKLALIDELFSTDYVNHAATADITADREGYKVRMGYMIEAFPDLNLAIDDMFSQGDQVAVRLTASGTNTGIYVGHPPTGKHATWTAVAIYRLVDGRVVERWENRDDLGLNRQLGIVG